jgi:predicted DNA-binding transcriptional regulator YafY
MPVTKNPYLRYKAIDSRLRNRQMPKPTIQDLIKACERDTENRPSLDTVVKDIKNMRGYFHAPIDYCRTKKVYEYTDDAYRFDGVGLMEQDINSIKNAIELIQSIGSSRVSGQFEHAMEKVLSAYREKFPQGNYKKQFIQTDSPRDFRGFEHFDLFFRAIKDRIPVSIVHYSYSKHNFTSRIIHPMLLKEFDNRWYIVAFSEEHNEVRTFGFDRISDPVLLYGEFTEHQGAEALEKLKNLYGVYPIDNQPLQTIVFDIAPNELAYFRSFPIHESQEFLMVHNSGRARIKVDLIPSFELVRLLRSYGSNIRIVEPEWLRLEVTEKIKR